MTKITIINCIIAAVYIFQIAEAGLLNKLPLGPLLDTVQNQISNTVKNVTELGKEEIQNLTDGLVTPQVGLSTSTSCSNMSINIQEAIKQVVNSLDTCIMQTNGSARIEKLTTALSNLQSNVLKNLQDAPNCMSNPLNISCFSEITNISSQLFPIIANAVNAANEAIEFFPTIGMCITMEIEKLPNQIMGQIGQNLGQCVLSLGLPFKL